MGSTSRPAQGLAQEYRTTIMKDFAKWLVWGVIVIAIAVSISIAVLGHKNTGSLGAITSPATVLDFLTLQQGLGFGVNGQVPVTMAGNRVALAGPSLFPCVITNPYTSTSTINDFSLNISTATSTAFTLVIGTTTSATATSTTPFLTQVVGSGALITSSFGAGLNNSIIGPGQSIVAGTAAGALPTGVLVGGSCSATFQSAV